MQEAKKRLNKAILVISTLVWWEVGLNLAHYILVILYLKGITLILDLIRPKIMPLIDKHKSRQ